MGPNPAIEVGSGFIPFRPVVLWFFINFPLCFIGISVGHVTQPRERVFRDQFRACGEISEKCGGGAGPGGLPTDRPRIEK